MSSEAVKTMDPFQMTEEEVKRRKNYIGASEAGAILGQCPFRTALDIYEDKISDEPNYFSNIYTRRGLILESHVKDAAVLRYKNPVREGCVRFSEDVDFLSCTPDFIYEDGGLMQIKTASDKTKENYGLDDTNDIPLNYLFQCYHELLVTGAPYCDLVVLFASEGQFDAMIYMSQYMEKSRIAEYMEELDLRRYRVERDEGRLNKLKDVCREILADKEAAE